MTEQITAEELVEWKKRGYCCVSETKRLIAAYEAQGKLLALRDKQFQDACSSQLMDNLKSVAAEAAALKRAEQAEAGLASAEARVKELQAINSEVYAKANRCEYAESHLKDIEANNAKVDAHFDKAKNAWLDEREGFQARVKELERIEAAHVHFNLRAGQEALSAQARMEELAQLKENWSAAAERQKSIADTANRFADQQKLRAQAAEARVSVLRDAAATFAGAVFRSACAKTSVTPALFDAHDDFMKVLSILDSSADRLTGEMEALRELAAAVMDGGPSSKREAAALCAWEKATK